MNGPDTRSLPRSVPSTSMMMTGSGRRRSVRRLPKVLTSHDARGATVVPRGRSINFAADKSAACTRRQGARTCHSSHYNSADLSHKHWNHTERPQETWRPHSAENECMFRNKRRPSLRRPCHPGKCRQDQSTEADCKLRPPSSNAARPDSRCSRHTGSI
jgi:hypothetical protein